MIKGFEVGPRIDILSLPEDIGRQLVGNAIYDLLLSAPFTRAKGSYKVVKVDRNARTITISYGDDE